MRIRTEGALSLGGAALVLWLVLGMSGGLVLSTHILGRFWPFSPYVPQRPVTTSLSDPVWQFTPWVELARHELLAGRLPLWNPHQSGGVPLLGNSISALGSPLLWPALLFGVARGWNLSLLLRLLVALAGTWAWLREAGRSRPAAALGAAGFALSGAFVAWLEHPQTLTAAPVPLVLLFVGRCARRVEGRDVVGLAVATYVVLSGGHPETALMAALLAGAVLLSGARRKGALARPAGAALLGAGLAAPLLLPFLDYLRESAALSGLHREPFVLPDAALLRFLLPQPGSWHPVESAASVSLALVFLVPFGLRKGRRLVWAIAALAGLLAAYDGPVARFLAHETPVRCTRTLLLVPLVLAWLGARGLDTLRARARRAGRGTLGRRFAWGLAACGALELLLSARGVHDVNPPSTFAPRTPMLARLAGDREAFHVLPLHTFLPTNTATLYGLDDLRGYDALEPAGFLRSREEIGRFGATPTQTDVVEPWLLRPGGKALDAWSVKYLMLHPQFRFGAETLNARSGLDLAKIYEGTDGRLLLNRRALPRVRLELPDGSVRKARVLLRHAGSWEIETDAPEPAMLVLADPFFPGWRVRVDGRRASPVDERAGSMVRVRLAAGRHVVSLRYLPASFLAGLALAGLALLLLVRTARAPAGARGPRLRAP